MYYTCWGYEFRENFPIKVIRLNCAKSPDHTSRNAGFPFLSTTPKDIDFLFWFSQAPSIHSLLLSYSV